MKLDYPTKRPVSITQGYNDNANPLYKSEGMLCHGALDIGGDYGANIYSGTDCFLYSTINMGQSPDKYRAVYTLVDESDFSYEVSYGHVIDCPHELRVNIKKGEVIAHMGNFGDVYSGDHKVTVEERLNGSVAGTHLHYQVRKCIRVEKRTNGKTYLQDSNGYIKLNGFLYEVVDYDNGAHGCVDPKPFLTGNYADETKFIFNKDLYFGLTDPDVKELQVRLNVLPQSGYFGPLTLEAVKKYQNENNIKPVAGYCGKLTRASLNS